MSDSITIRIAQEHETLVTTLERPGYRCRYAYARSADSQAADDVGQDRLVLQVADRCLHFALCDGVSQSFMGDLAARLLADALIDWLEEARCSDGEALQASLNDRLTALVAEVQPHVNDFVLPEDLAPLIHDVLLQKQALGSESTFIAGVLDLDQRRLILAWMGDSRIRIWGREEERTDQLGATFHTAERWSSHRGPVGTPHTISLSLAGITRLLLYSDGLAVLDQHKAVLSNDNLAALITTTGEAPNSDDVSILEVCLDLELPEQDALNEVASTETRLVPVIEAPPPPATPELVAGQLHKKVVTWTPIHPFRVGILALGFVLLIILILRWSGVL
jgi:hypothetical protein